MKIAIPKERREYETRVSATPDTIKKLIDLGFDVVVEKDAGSAARIVDADYTAAGATLADDFAATVKDADMVTMVLRPLPDQIDALPEQCLLLGQLAPFADRELIDKLAQHRVSAMALELMPRISRAQYMDVLSSQSNLAGYRAVIDAVATYDRAIPMMMTAAGTIAPAKVLVMGAGVAGLQAVATARRLGAIVSATDVRPAVKEQVESLGGRFIMVEDEELADAETQGGYAKEMSEDYQRRQAELIAKTITEQDIVICTALIPGKKAPVLVTETMVKTMKPGSVIVDLAVEQGGNCPLSQPGEIVEVQGVRIVGHRNVPGRLPGNASSLYAKNLLNFITTMVDKESKTLAVDWQDELVTGTLLCRDGQIVHPALNQGENS